MIKVKDLENGSVEVSSDTGYVDIGQGPVKKLVIKKEELEYVTETKE